MAAPKTGTASNDAGARAAHEFRRDIAFVHRSLLRRGVRPADADDLTQDVLLVLWRRWCDYDSSRPFQSWVLGIVAKVARRYHARRHRDVPGGLAEPVDPAPSAEEQISRSRERILVTRALAALKEEHRSVLLLHDREGLPLDDVARILQAPRSTVHSRLKTARLRFAEVVRRLTTGGETGRSRMAVALLTSSRGRAQLGSPLGHRAVTRLGQIPHARPTPRRCRSSRTLTEGRSTWWTASGLAGAGLACLVWLFSHLMARDAGGGLSGPEPSAGAETPVKASTTRSSRLRRPPVFAATLPHFASTPSVATSSDLSRGLVAFWRFGEMEGSVAVDRSGQGNNCALRTRRPRASSLPAAPTGALLLPGDRWLECPPSSSLARPGAELTIATRVRTKGGRPRVQTVLARQKADGAGDDLFFGIFTRAPEVDELVFNSRTWMVRLGSTLPAGSGQWRHLAATHAADGQTTLYVDGQRVATRLSTRRGAVLAGARTLFIGAGSNGRSPAVVSQHFEGDIEDLLLYDRARADEEIGALAAGGGAASLP
jgi:RNA polymerase sigma-70 factor, ECF subfamily